MIRRSDQTPMLPVMRIAAAVGVAIVSIVAVPMAVGLSLAQEMAVETGDGKLRETEIEQRRTRIQQEIATLKQHPWAGDYYEGDGLGANISISLAPDTGIAATWHGCLGLYGANRGKVVERDGTLRFEYEQPNAPGFGGFPDTLRPVRWGERRYMIRQDKMMGFVNAINHGLEPRERVHGMFLLAREDENKAAEGLPDLPPAYLALIRRAPMRVRVVSIDGVDKKKSDQDCSYTYRMTLDRGATDRFAPGIELKPDAQPHVWESATIETVTGETSTAKMAVWYDDCTHPKTVPTTGWVFTTGAYDGKSGVAR